MAHNLGRWLILFIVVITWIDGSKGSCLTFTRLSCTEGSKRGLGEQNRPETRLIPAMEFNCTGTLVGWTVSGRRGSGTMYPKLQIWRRSSTRSNTYNKNGPEIQIDAQGSACETITRSCDNDDRTFHCKLSAANKVSIHSGSDIIGVELPPLENQGFELFFISSSQSHYVWRSEVTTSSLTLTSSSYDVLVRDYLFLDAEVQDTDECLANTDGCDQVCTNTIGSFQCSCIDGYTLSSDGKSCTDTNECTDGTHDCQQRCVNINGGFLCDCNSGYQLVDSDRRTCSDINECSSTSTNWCDQLCTNTIGSFRCGCNAGYALSSNGRSCLDINECTAGIHNCQQRCINISGGFLCDCNSGYQLNSDGRTCSDIDECSSNNCCDQVCTNNIGSFQCSCNVGYRLAANGRSCIDINECAVNNGSCQHMCSNIDGSFICSCRNGYLLDTNQLSCIDIDECTTNTHGCEHGCNNTKGSFQCSCNNGYRLISDGRTCLDNNECLLGTHNCEQHCVNTVGSFRCECDSGYLLTNSSDRVSCIDINECANNNGSCQHNCSNTDGSFLCSCRNGYVLGTDQLSCIEVRVNSSIKQQLCLITGAVVGGAIGTPLLFTIFLLVIALVYTIKRNGRKSSNDIIQTNDMRMRMEEISSDLVKGSVENSASPYMYDNEHIYSTVHDEDKMRADDDEYVNMNYSN